MCNSVCHDVFCSGDLTMKDWCHNNNILQVNSWGCLIVQVMFHVLMTASMTSPGHKVGQIFELRHGSKAQNIGYANGFLLVYSTSGITSGKKFVASSNWRTFWKFWNIKHSFNLISDMNRSSQIMPQKAFFMIMTSSMTSHGGLKIGPLYSLSF